MIVVDASVAVKWLLPEDHSESALRLLEGETKLIAPSIIRLEVAGAISQHFREKRISEQRARAAYEAWEKIMEEGVIQRIPFDEVFVVAMELAFKTRHAVADCLYLAVAQRMDASVITADRPFQRRGSKGHAKIALLEGMASEN